MATKSYVVHWAHRTYPHVPWPTRDTRHQYRWSKCWSTAMSDLTRWYAAKKYNRLWHEARRYKGRDILPASSQFWLIRLPQSSIKRRKIFTGTRGCGDEDDLRLAQWRCGDRRAMGGKGVDGTNHGRNSGYVSGVSIWFYEAFESIFQSISFE